jgi:tetratricopeptide (TPR) repeat protein
VVIERPVAATLSDLAHMELEAGDLSAARLYAEEALALRRTLGLPHGIAHALLAVGAVEYHSRDFNRAREVYAEATAVYEAAGSQGDVYVAKLELAECELLVGRLEEAERLLREALIGARKLADQTIEIQALRVAGMLAAGKGDGERAAFLLGVASGKLQDSGLTLFSALEDEVKRSFVDRARGDVGDVRFEAAYERGLEGWESVGSELVLTSLD